MAYEFNLPDIGEGLTEADIVRWVVPVGGTVEVDQVLVEVETAKAVVEMPAPVAGVVLHHGAAEGETLDVGSILCVIGAAGEQWGDSTSIRARRRHCRRLPHENSRCSAAIGHPTSCLEATMSCSCRDMDRRS